MALFFGANMTQLIAQKPVFYAGRTHRAGEKFEAPEAHASLLLKTRQVRRFIEEADEMPKVEKVRRQYRRRDMRAEP